MKIIPAIVTLFLLSSTLRPLAQQSTLGGTTPSVSLPPAGNLQAPSVPAPTSGGSIKPSLHTRPERPGAHPKPAQLPNITSANIKSAIDYVLQKSALKQFDLNFQIQSEELPINEFFNKSATELLGLVENSEFANSRPEAIISSLKDRAKRIYGPDDRNDLNLFEALSRLGNHQAKERSKNIIELATAVCCMTLSSRVHQDQLGNYLVQSDRSLMCPTERFHDQPRLGFGTAFLVAPDIVMTAAHCLDDTPDISKISFIFDYGTPSGNEWGDRIVGNLIRFPSSSVCFGKKLISKVQSGLIDWALIKVDRTFERKPITRLLTRSVSSTDKIFVVGHPHGLPIKVADQAMPGEIHGNRSFLCNLDTYGGNSGSPVFLEDTFELVGILVSGGADWRFVLTDVGCLASIYVGENEKGSEGVTQTAQFSSFLNQ